MSDQVTVSLAPLDSTDMGIVRSWRNRYEIWQYCRQHDQISDAEQVRWFNRQSEDSTVRMYKLVVTKGKALTPVGVCGLTSIDHVNRRAEFSLFIAPEAQRQGLGRIGLSLLLDHGFKNLGLNLIWGESFEGNPAIRMFVAMGFSFEGRRRQFYFRNGKFIDAHLFSITAEEWNARSDTGTRSSELDSKPSDSCDAASAEASTSRDLTGDLPAPLAAAKH